MAEDRELEAMETTLRALQALNPAERQRVFAWLAAKLELARIVQQVGHATSRWCCRRVGRVWHARDRVLADAGSARLRRTHDACEVCEQHEAGEGSWC